MNYHIGAWWRWCRCMLAVMLASGAGGASAWSHRCRRMLPAAHGDARACCRRRMVVPAHGTDRPWRRQCMALTAHGGSGTWYRRLMLTPIHLSAGAFWRAHFDVDSFLRWLISALTLLGADSFQRQWITSPAHYVASVLSSWCLRCSLKVRNECNNC